MPDPTMKTSKERVTEIAVHFQQIPIALFGGASAQTRPNALVLRIQPDEGITLRFASKVPGTQLHLRDVFMDFRYGTTYSQSAPEAYERLLLESMHGDAMLFARSDEVDLAWRLVSPVLSHWESTKPRGFPNYHAGSWGPAEANALLAHEGHAWRRP